MSTDEPLQEPATYTPRTSISDSRNQEASTITIDFDGGHHVIVRPNRIIRGTVTLNSSERLYVTQIRIKFRADEIASVQVEEGHGDNRGQHIYQMTTTFFDVDWKLWGNEPSAFSLAAWEELETGQYTFPFALKFPNVNFPPSLEEPSGFCVRYVWTAVVDGPALSSGLRSKEFVTPYRPIIVAPPEREWIFKATLTKEKKAIAEVQAKLSKQAYCPDELFNMKLTITPVTTETRLSSITYHLRKHHEGRMPLQKGMAYREHIRVPVSNPVILPTDLTPQAPIVTEISFTIPTRLVSPSFASRHTRVRYDLYFLVNFEQGHTLFKSQHVAEFVVPIAIANLPNDQLLRIPDLTNIQRYTDSRESPLFFAPELEEPLALPPPSSLFPVASTSDLMGQLFTPATPIGSPPSYFSLPGLAPQPQTGRKERQEKVIYTTRVIKSGGAELGEALIIKGVTDEDW